MFSEVAIRRFATLSPARYSGLYAAWNVDVDRDGRADDPWDFGTVTQYPVLKVNFDGQGTASWQEFGHQLRAGLSLTATTFNGRPVALSWTVVDTSCPDRIASVLPDNSVYITRPAFSRASRDLWILASVVAPSAFHV